MIGEAAILLKISRSKIYELISCDEIPWFPVGSHKRFLTQELLNWAKNRAKQITSA